MGENTRGGGATAIERWTPYARLKKRIKRVVFHGRAMYARTVERVSTFGKKGILFNSFDTRLAYVYFTNHENTHFDTRLGYIFDLFIGWGKHDRILVYRVGKTVTEYLFIGWGKHDRILV